MEEEPANFCLMFLFFLSFSVGPNMKYQARAISGGCLKDRYPQGPQVNQFTFTDTVFFFFTKRGKCNCTQGGLFLSEPCLHKGEKNSLALVRQTLFTSAQWKIPPITNLSIITSVSKQLNQSWAPQIMSHLKTSTWDTVSGRILGVFYLFVFVASWVLF